MARTYANVSNSREFGGDKVCITRMLADIPGGVVLDATGYKDEVIKEGQVIPKDYTDRTGNLRSSVGYAILDNGELVQEPTVVSVVKDGKDGEARAKEYIKKLQSEYNDGLVLIVVAGMDYATYVQAKGYDVLVSADMKMEEMVERMVATFTDAGTL